MIDPSRSMQGERRHRADALPREMVVADVAEHGEHAADHTRFAAHETRADRDPAPLAVRPDDAHDEVVVLLAGREGAHGGVLLARKHRTVRPDRLPPRVHTRAAGELVVVEPEGLSHRAVEHDQRELGIERLGDAVEGQRDAADVVLAVEDRGELGELLRHPRSGDAHPNASSTTVRLWKPVLPLVRAISPYV
jgi:hypothetical protein